jgi:hypothetical protein
MKKTLLFLSIMAFGVMTFAQQSNQGKVSVQSKKDLALKKPSMKDVKEYMNTK